MTLQDVRAIIYSFIVGIKGESLKNHDQDEKICDINTENAVLLFVGQVGFFGSGLQAMGVALSLIMDYQY
ncbi:MAG: hypothetical protein JW860_07435 [Sedimentisphaerales bacterium]|nr:hypothetical protein [Sedimentisphaerales bacterium]